MSKIVLADAAGGLNLSVINDNANKIEEHLNDKVLYRDNPSGEPNQMESILDMNGQRIINLAAPDSPNDAARLADIPFEPIPIGTTTALLTTFSPASTIAATNVQAAIEEVNTDIRADVLNSADAAKGAGMIGFNPTLNYVASTLGRTVADRIISVRDFPWLAVGDGVTDDSASFQAAYDWIVSVGGGTIIAPRTAQGYKLNTALNFTNTFTPVDLVGDGVANLPNARPNDDALGSTLWLNTGTVGIDITGHGTFGLKNITLDTNHATKVTNPARVGILSARSTTSQQNQNHRFENVSVFMRTSGSSVTPSIALFADNVELAKYYNCSFFADVPVVLTYAVLYGVSSPFVTISDAVQSSTDNLFEGCTLVTCSGLGPSLRVHQTVNNTIIGSYFGNDEITVQTFPAILLTDPVQKLNILGFQSEGHENLFEATGNLIECNIYGTHASTSTTTAIGKFNTSGNVDGNRFHIYNSAASSGYNAYTGTITGGFRNNEFDLGYQGNVSLTVPSGVGATVNNSFNKIGATPIVVLTNAATASPFYLNKERQSSPYIRSSQVGLLKSNQTNNTLFGFATVSVPNSELSGQILIPYSVNSSDGQRFITGELRVSIARRNNSNSQIAIAESLAQVSQLVTGAETITLTWALSALSGASTADQSFTINCTINSSTAATGYVRGIAEVMSSYFTNLNVASHITIAN